MNVAQLKPGLALLHRAAGLAGFPRLNERGSIEANVAVGRLREPARFPRLNERGSIEAPERGSITSRRSPVSTFE